MDAGFAWDGDEWTMTRGDVRWFAFLSVVRSDEVHVDVAFSAFYLPAGEHAMLANQGMGQLPAASRPIYSVADDEIEDPLISDVRAVLLPYIDSMQSAPDIIRSRVDGILGAPWPESTELTVAYRQATEYGFPHISDEVVERIPSKTWTAGDRGVFREAGLNLRGITWDWDAPRWIENLTRTRGRVKSITRAKRLWTDG